MTTVKSSGMRSKSYERPEKTQAEILASSFGLEQLEQENRDLRLRVRRLECQLSEKEAEIMRLKASQAHVNSMLDLARERHTDVERYRAGQMQAEKLLEAREQSHRQQVARLESQVELQF